QGLAEEHPSDTPQLRRGRSTIPLRDSGRGSGPQRTSYRSRQGTFGARAVAPRGVRDEARGRTFLRGHGGPFGHHRRGTQDARASSTRGAPGTTRGEIRLMLDNLNMHPTPDGQREPHGRPSRDNAV